MYVKQFIWYLAFTGAQYVLAVNYRHYIVIITKSPVVNLYLKKAMGHGLV